MAFSSNPNRETSNRDFYLEMILPTCPLPIVRLKTTSYSIIRLVPEVDAAGNNLPASAGLDQYGHTWTNIIKEAQLILSGNQQKFTGLTRSADRPGERDLDNPWKLAYIYFKGQLNAVEFQEKIARGEQPKGKPGRIDAWITPAVIAQLKALFAKPANKSAMFQQPADSVMGQGFVFVENGVPVPADKLRLTIISMGNSAGPNMASALTNCLKLTGKDPFAYDTGYSLRVMAKPKGEGAPPDFGVELEQLAPIPTSFQTPTNRFVPWDKCLKLHTYDAHIRKLVECYGAGLIGLHPNLAEQMNRLGVQTPILTSSAMTPIGATQAPTQPVAATSAPAAPAAGFGVVTPPASQPAPAVGFGAPAPTPTPSAPTPPVSTAPAVGFGAPASTAVVAPGFGVPQASTQAPPVPPLATPAAATPASMEAAYLAIAKGLPPTA